jgi:hypothetical protein
VRVDAHDVAVAGRKRADRLSPLRSAFAEDAPIA